MVFAREDAFEADKELSINFNSDDEINKGEVLSNQIMVQEIKGW